MQQARYSSQGWLGVIIELSGKPKFGYLFSLFEQPTTANKQLAVTHGSKINKTKGKSESKIFLIFELMNWKQNKANVTIELLMIKNSTRDYVFTWYPSIINMVVIKHKQ
jgi:hypothetical protein